MCTNPAMDYFRGDGCCKVGCNQGLGSSCCYLGGEYWFAPEWLGAYSVWRSIGERRGPFYDVSIMPNNQFGH